LIKNNAKVGANIAKKLSEIRNNQTRNCTLSNTNNHVTLIGGINIDLAFKLIDDKTLKLKGVTQPCVFNTCLGGVARNMAESLMKFGNKSTLLSAISNDLVGNSIIEKSKSIGFDTSKWLILDHNKQTSTGSYCSLFDKQGELLLGLGAMEAHDYIKPEFLKKHENLYEKSSICIVDADLSVESLRYILNKCYKDFKLPVWYNPTDLRKCMRVIEAKSLSKITFMSPNSKELLAIFLDVFGKANESDDRINEIQIKQKLNTSELKNLEKIFKNYKKSSQIDKIDKIDNENLKLILKYLLIYVPFIFLSRGSNDLILASACKLNLYERQQLPIKRVQNDESLINEWSPQLSYFPVIKLDSCENIINVSGAGDNTSAGIVSGILKDYDLITCVYNGLLAAKYTLMTNENLSPKISTIDLKVLNNIIEDYKDNVKIEYF
jgi:sugar/nucleoside kinase (ribokinase family)